MASSINKEVKELLEDIYELDESLREQDVEVEQVVKQFIMSRPKPTLDKAFVKRLRDELGTAIGSIPVKKKQRAAVPVPSPKRSVKPWLFAFSGLALGVIATFLVFSGPMLTSYIPFIGGEAEDVTGVRIDRIAPKAFGAIAPGEVAEVSAMPETERSALERISSKVVISEGPAIPVSEDLGVSVRVLPPEFTKRIEYVYNGDTFSIDEQKMDVLRQVTGSIVLEPLRDIVSGLNLGLANLGTFPNLEVRDIALAQDVEFGYMVHVSMQQGMVSITQNWERWEAIQPKCRDEACWEAYRLKPSDVPSNQRLVEIANAFMTEHGIDLSSYGSPEVNREWERIGEGTSEIYVPDTVQVVYPLEIQGKPVYTPSGNKTGLWVGINIRANRVSDVSDIRTLRFEASSYDTLTDTDDILDRAKTGGLYANVYPENAETIQVEIGTPWLAYVQVYESGAGRTGELHVPALVFPVIGDVDPNLGLSKRNVIVPIVKGVVEDSRIPFPNPRPLIEPAMPGVEPIEEPMEVTEDE